MRISQNQKGLVLIDLLIAVSTIAVLVILFQLFMQKQLEKDKISNQVKRVEQVYKAELAYYVNTLKSTKIPNITNNWTNSFTTLMNGGYLPGCTDTEYRSGQCIPSQKTLWDEDISLSVTTTPAGDAVVDMTVPFHSSRIGSVQDKERLANAIAVHLPMAKVERTGNNFDVTMTIQRPGTEVAHEELVRRDGTATLTGEWDVGNQGITNVRDMTIHGLTDRTVLQGLTYTNMVKNLTIVPRLICPIGSSKVQILPSAYSRDGRSFNEFGAVEGRYDVVSGGLRVYVRVWDKDPVTGVRGWFIPNANSATVVVMQHCEK
ncbi:hypothetical protein [Dongshaea marina]|uniref:hypothetical protein n=1 Tax=Dongshaea marina TaxID=2047966 RepID=UPI000D3E0492|nr:hypothetical protein [Dongshaea marina]